MSGFVVDANVLSEMSRPNPNPSVVSFFNDSPELWLSVIVIHELEFGVQRLDAGRRRDRYRDNLSAYLARYGNRVLPVGRPEAVFAAGMRAQAARTGRVVHVADALIAGTARANDLAVATRNVRDFEGFDVEIVNPWEHV
ncbi:MAG: type II toxin-antitoxin system VapC family toxin [Chloroflexi bacterium]|nr:type II toxin-antitoxin system VapC family toxin [Chloroflexota bacterium]MYE31580.1 type II toxin-antitoxin system VapC family toxin [Chloroflexota bacterium]